jgi:hypothetical protein
VADSEVVDEHVFEIDVVCEGFQRIGEGQEERDRYAVYDAVSVEKAESLRCVDR